jgi:hypothetical protein
MSEIVTAVPQDFAARNPTYVQSTKRDARFTPGSVNFIDHQGLPANPPEAASDGDWDAWSIGYLLVEIHRLNNALKPHVANAHARETIIVEYFHGFVVWIPNSFSTLSSQRQIYHGTKTDHPASAKMTPMHSRCWRRLRPRLWGRGGNAISQDHMTWSRPRPRKYY